MSINIPYKSSNDIPDVISLFPLPGALLLPREELPLNVFEPRYLEMVDAALASHRIIGMIQPDIDAGGPRNCPRLYRVGCAGRITSICETGDGRYMLTLTGIARFRIVEELTVMTPYRQSRVDFTDFSADFMTSAGEDEVDRAGVLRTLKDFARVNRVKVNWKGIDKAPNEALVNALVMMSPFGPREKQALLEAKDLKSRADVLIAITAIELAQAERTGSSIQ